MIHLAWRAEARGQAWGDAMARPNLLRQKLAAGRTCVGPLFQEFWSPELFEFCGLAGFDFLAVDGEHAGVDPLTARNLMRAAQGVGVTGLARIPENNPSLILRFLDAGVEGLILPHCNSAADAEAFVSACKYPPRGIRGASSSSRAAGYGFTQSPRQHVEQADREVLCLGLIEEPRAVESLPEILKVDGLDGCFIGAGDMALLLGREFHGGPTTHPEVQKLVDRAIDLTLQSGKLLMLLAATGAEARAQTERGAHLIVMNFGLLVRRAIEDYLGALRTPDPAP
jgi:4-hydroxy-2-oxoheptanedioate aldolase